MLSGDKIIEYWDNQPATIDGVLGGYQEIDEVDVQTSCEMLEMARGHISSFKSALDCGAGIGRITNSVLKGRFENIDLLEQSTVQITEAKRRLKKVVRTFV